MDIFVMRFIVLVLAVIGGIFFGYLGYRLFVLGHTGGPGKLEFNSKIAKVVFSGQGAGLFFMAFGGIILILAVLNNASRETVRGMSAQRAQQDGTAQLEDTQGAMREQMDTLSKQVEQKIERLEEFVKTPGTPDKK